MWPANIQKANEYITDGCLRLYLPLRRSFPDFPPRSFYTSSLKISKKKLHMPADTDIIKETGEELFWRQAPELR